jgi:hypothetical protein
MKKLIVLFLTAGCFLAASSNAQTDANASSAGTSSYYAVLIGANELTTTTPAADPTAVGFAKVTADPAAGTVVYVLVAPDLANISAAHIHEGPPGVVSGVVVPFNAPFTNGISSGTTTGVSAAVINRILANPANFYVNIHNNPPFPGGAIRGTLQPAPGTAIGSCLPDQTTLCLNQGRFKAQVAFQTSTIPAGAGNALPLTGDTGSFWFFTANNIEMTIKVVDGRAVNGKFWFFAGALSDVAYTITVTDLTTGAVKTYSSTRGIQTALNDTSAF